MNQQDSSTPWVDPWIDATPLPIPDGLTWLLTKILDGRNCDAISFTRPVNAEHVCRCDFCDALILPCVLVNGREYDAVVFVDVARDKEWCVDIYQPHRCEYSQRYQEFLVSETEEPGEDF